MTEIRTALIVSSIDVSKIPGLDYFYTAQREEGHFDIVLNDGNSIRIYVKYIPKLTL